MGESLRGQLCQGAAHLLSLQDSAEKTCHLSGSGRSQSGRIGVREKVRVGAAPFFVAGEGPGDTGGDGLSGLHEPS